MGQPEKTAIYGVSIFALWCQFGHIYSESQKEQQKTLFFMKKHTHVTVKCWKMEIMEMWHQKKKKRTTGVALALYKNRPICTYQPAHNAHEVLGSILGQGQLSLLIILRGTYLLLLFTYFTTLLMFNIMHCVWYCLTFCVVLAMSCSSFLHGSPTFCFFEWN